MTYKAQTADQKRRDRMIKNENVLLSQMRTVLDAMDTMGIPSVRAAEIESTYQTMVLSKHLASEVYGENASCTHYDTSPKVAGMIFSSVAKILYSAVPQAAFLHSYKQLKDTAPGTKRRIILGVMDFLKNTSKETDSFFDSDTFQARSPVTGGGNAMGSQALHSRMQAAQEMFEVHLHLHDLLSEKNGMDHPCSIQQETKVFLSLPLVLPFLVNKKWFSKVGRDYFGDVTLPCNKSSKEEIRSFLYNAVLWSEDLLHEEGNGVIDAYHPDYPAVIHPYVTEMMLK